MGFSETYFFLDIEAVEEKHRRRMPAKPRSVKLDEAKQDLRYVETQHQGMLRDLAEASKLLESVPAELVEHLTVNNSRWKEMIGDDTSSLWRISSTKRHQMDRLHKQGAKAIEGDIERWAAEKMAAAEAAVAQAESLPVVEAEEKAWNEWSTGFSEEIEEMHDEYDRRGQWG
jgi:hypothetical protein